MLDSCSFRRIEEEKRKDEELEEFWIQEDKSLFYLHGMLINRINQKGVRETKNIFKPAV